MSVSDDAAHRALTQALSYTATHHGSSRWSELRRCPRAHNLRYEQLIRLKEPADYFAIGQLVHSVLAYAAMGEIEGFRWSVKDILEQAAEIHPRDVIAEASRLLGAYFAQWGPENAGYGDSCGLLEVEHFVASKKLRERYTGRCDALVEWRDDSFKELQGRLVIVDHKTRKSMPRDDMDTLASKWRTLPQFIGLAHCVREVEGETPGFMVNTIAKTQIPTFRRIMWEYTDEELDRWAEEHDRMLEQHLGADWMNYSECADGKYGQACWAFKWCHGSEAERTELYVKPEQLNRKRKAVEEAAAAQD